ncbi:MAG: hypothetical protein V1872_10550 [bacterium]
MLARYPAILIINKDEQDSSPIILKAHPQSHLNNQGEVIATPISNDTCFYLHIQDKQGINLNNPDSIIFTISSNPITSQKQNLSQENQDKKLVQAIALVTLKDNKDIANDLFVGYYKINDTQEIADMPDDVEVTITVEITNVNKRSSEEDKGYGCFIGTIR